MSAHPKVLQIRSETEAGVEPEEGGTAISGETTSQHQQTRAGHDMDTKSLHLDAMATGGAIDEATVPAILERLTDGDLSHLISFASQEARRRGLHREPISDKLSRLVSNYAAEREEAEAARQAELARKEQAKAAKMRALAIRARTLFGNDYIQFRVNLWEKLGDRRVYVGFYKNTWVEYYHTGNSRTNPGTLKVESSLLEDLAESLGVSEDEAKNQIKAFCVEICKWKQLTLEVNPDNAPQDPKALRTRYRWVMDDYKSRAYSTEEALRQAIPLFKPEVAAAELRTVVAEEYYLKFAPRE